ncbi:MAG: hypothetical protein ACOCQR_00185 [bacterium]
MSWLQGRWERIKEIIELIDQAPHTIIEDRIIPPAENFLTTWLLQQIIHLSNFLIVILLDGPIMVLSSSVFETVYNRVCMVLSIFILIIVLSHGFSLISGSRRLEQLPKSFFLLLLLPFVNFITPVILLRALQIVRSFCIILYGTVDIGEQLYSENFSLHMLVIYGIYFIYLGRLLLHYAKKHGELLLMIITFPVLYLCWTLPDREHNFLLWLKDVRNVLIFQVLHVLGLVILFSMTYMSEADPVVVVLQVGVLAYLFDANGNKFIEKYISKKKYSRYNDKEPWHFDVDSQTAFAKKHIKNKKIKDGLDYLANPAKVTEIPGRIWRKIKNGFKKSEK